MVRLILRTLMGVLFMGHGLQKLAGWFGGYGLEGTGRVLREHRAAAREAPRDGGGVRRDGGRRAARRSGSSRPWRRPRSSGR